MFDIGRVGELGTSEALSLVQDARQARRRAEIVQAVAILHVVTTYRHDIARDKVALGNDGTPRVDEFAALEIAAALGQRPESVTARVANLLDLAYRLPLVWDATCQGRVDLWIACRIAATTSRLNRALAGWVDQTVAPFVSRLGTGRLLRFTEALVVQADTAAADRVAAGADLTRDVRIGGSRNGVRDVFGVLTAADAAFLDASLTQIADILARHGSAHTAGQRRSDALGLLATPARALALIQHDLAQPALGLAEPGPAEAQGSAAAPGVPQAGTDAGPRSPAGCAGHACGTITVDPDRLLPRATLYVHISRDTLTTGRGVARCEHLGPVTVTQLRDLLGHTRVTVRPVFDPDHVIPVDSYEIPERVRRAVLLRHPFDLTPYGTRESRRLDLDHTRPYRHDDTPGQTGTHNLGPLTRTTHRAKTHAGWHLTQSAPGHFTWATPLGRRYTITPSGLTLAQQPSASSPPATRPAPRKSRRSRRERSARPGRLLPPAPKRPGGRGRGRARTTSRLPRLSELPVLRR